MKPSANTPPAAPPAEVVGFLGPIPAIEQNYWESLGFVANRDKVGYAGIENYMNDVLVGKNGSRVVEVDNSGQILRDLEPPVESVPGNSIVLTIDTRLQAAAKAALVNWMAQKSLLLNKKYTSGCGDCHGPAHWRGVSPGVIPKLRE